MKLSTFFCVAATLLVIGSGNAKAQEIAGEYFATFLDNGLPQPVWLKLKGVQPGNNDNELTYSKPRNCTLAFEYGGAAGNAHYFYFDNDWGHGWCRARSSKDLILRVTPENGRDMRYELIKDSKAIETIIVKRK